MGIHLGDDIDSYKRLLALLSGGLAYNCIVEILPQVSDDPEMLQWLRMQLADVSSRYPSMRTAIGNEAGVWGNSINRGRDT